MPRPESFMYAPQYGRVLRVHPRTWEVDVEAAVGGLIQRAVIVGPRLPEVSTQERPQWCLLWWANAQYSQPFCLPISSRLPSSRYERDELVWLDEVQGYKITIRAPGNTGEVVADQTGELEIRSEKGGRLLQIRILEENGVIRLDTPKVSVVLHDDDGDVTVECERDATVDAGRDVAVTAGQNISATATAGSIEAQAGTKVSVQAPLVEITAPIVNITGTVNITGLLNVA